MKEKPLTYEHGVKLAKEVIAFSEVRGNRLITAFHWVWFIQGELLQGASVGPIQRLKLLFKQAGPRHRLWLLSLLFCWNTQLSSKQSSKVQRAAGGKQTANQVLLPTLPQSSVSCSGFCQKVYVANPSLQHLLPNSSLPLTKAQTTWFSLIHCTSSRREGGLKVSVLLHLSPRKAGG